MGDESFLEGRITWYPGPDSWVRFSYFQVNRKGENRLERTITFRGSQKWGQTLEGF